MTENNARAEVVLYWWDKGTESLTAARRELTAGANEFAINRVYYALFYAVSALLLEKGLGRCLRQWICCKSSVTYF